MSVPPGDKALRMAALTAALVLVILATCVPLHTNDFWLQARIGQMIVEEGRVPHTLLFPFTPAADYPFNLHEALPSVVFHLLDRLFGYDQLLFVKCALGLLMFGLLARATWRLSGRLEVGLALAVLGMVCMNYRFVMRPELFALFLLLGVLVLCCRVRDGASPRLLAWGLPLQVVWANSHASFILGPCVAGIFAVGEAWDTARRRGLRAGLKAGQPYALLGIGLLLVSLLNPLGGSMLLFPFYMNDSGVISVYIYEWHSPFAGHFQKEPGFWLVAATLLVGLGIATWQRLRLRATDVLLLLTFCGLALTRVRHGVWLGLVVPVVCAGLLRRPDGAAPAPPVQARPWMAGVLLACLAGIAAVFQFGNAYRGRPYFTPTQNFTLLMREQLESPELQGNVVVSMELGAELIYRAWPRLKPSFDSRIDSYGEDYIVMHLRLLQDEARLLEFLDRYDVRYMLLLRRDFDDELSRFQQLKARGWRVKFIDHRAVLMRRA